MYTPRLNNSSRGFGGRVALGLLVALVASLASTDAPAEWPPPESATSDDLADPANWPNDPGYAYCPSASPYCGDNAEDGAWIYYSFIPTQEAGSGLRPEETASGMSVDLAWRYTQGDDSIRIGVMDSGIRWSEADLFDSIWLNPGELSAHKPTQGDGSPCGDAGELVGFDCNGDGIFTATDYGVGPTPVLQPEAVDGRPKGDANMNGVLDPEDILLNFSDGIDDDANGYLDDVAGWDFMKDDNNPFDDTSYGHGTSEARWSTATGNNGIGGIGACPKCRVIPLRVADSFVADCNAYGQAIVYAVDNGAKATQSALGTVTQSALCQAAMDYAWERGVINVVSMADENARHHNAPTPTNHSLPVHSMVYSGSRATDAVSFLAFDPCSNFGGQNMLSVSAGGCSSEAVAQTCGMSGLLYSAALKYGVAGLRAGEVMQLLITSADDVDIPESREIDDSEDAPPNPFRWSQPGFDQRFGYGRPNANRAVEMVKDGKIPPAIDIVSPTWFSVLYKDQVTGPVAIEATVSASRATSYDYVVEWAPGVQPLDGEFVEVASESNVPADVVSGSDDALARLEIRSIDLDHERDVDSPGGENDHTITVRVRATAHYGGDIGDVRAILHRTYYVYSDPDLVKGFPVYVGASGESSPKLADIDGDGLRDLVLGTSDGRLHVWSITNQGPVYVDGFPYLGTPIDGLAPAPPLPGKPSYLGAPGYGTGPGQIDPATLADAFVGTPAIGDVDDDGKPEIVITSWNGFIQVVNHDGTLADGWPVRMPEIPSCPTDGSTPDGPCMSTEQRIDRGSFGAPVLIDMDKDGQLDIVQSGFDGKIYVYHADGSPVDGWPVTIHYPGHTFPSGNVLDEPPTGRVVTTVAVADFDDDGYPEVLSGSNEKLGTGSGAGALYLVDGRGNAAGDPPYMPNWPVTISSFETLPLIGEGTTNAGCIGRFDGVLAAVMHGNASLPEVLPVDPGAQRTASGPSPNELPVRDEIDSETGEPYRGLVSGARFGELTTVEDDVMFPLFALPSLGDIDQDGTLDVVASGSSLSFANDLLAEKPSGKRAQHLLAIWSGKTGLMLPASPYRLEDVSFVNSHAIADLNGDDYPEVVVGSSGYFLHAYDGCGREPAGWPKFTGQWILATPAVGDVDGDDKLEVAIVTRTGWVYLWHTEGRTDGQVLWESFHHDNRNTGNFEEPLEQGDRTRLASEPITVELCRSFVSTEETPVKLEPGGGCGCKIAGATPERHSAPWLLLLGLAALGARRRRAA